MRALADAPVDLGHHRIVDQGGLLGDGVRGEQPDPAVPEQRGRAWQPLDELHGGADEPGRAVAGQCHGRPIIAAADSTVPVLFPVARDPDAVIGVFHRASLGGVDQASGQITALLDGIPPGVGLRDQELAPGPASKVNPGGGPICSADPAVEWVAEEGVVAWLAG